MTERALDTHQKALKMNLDKTKYGTFAEIGAGQEVARWFFRVGAAAGTIAKSISAYDSPGYVRDRVWKRDAGACRLCGFNVGKAERLWRRQKPRGFDRVARRRWRAARPRWEADHIVPVADGGGECGLENYRLLCRDCHRAVTSQWRKTRVTSCQLAVTGRQ